jgi:molybdopterin molybdotransferase
MTPDQAIALIAQSLAPVGTQTVALAAAAGRVLAEPIATDRDSPPHDVSAMDGYAARRADLARATLPIAGEVEIGQPPPRLPAGAVLRIVTGAMAIGQFIRRRGENAPAGHPVLAAGTLLTAPALAALAAFGQSSPRVYRPVRVAILTTGNELLLAADTPAPWQIRDSNGPALRALLSAIPWLEVCALRHVPDDPQAIAAALEAQLAGADALLTTGGVSLGQHDHIPGVLAALGAQTLFHRLPIRPGHPLLAAIGPNGQAIFGLPGNPLSVLATATRFAAVALRRRAGWAICDPAPTLVYVDAPDAPRAALTWYRPARLAAPGVAEVVAHRGSGDLVAPAPSTGFVETAPDAPAVGLLPYRPWAI